VQNSGQLLFLAVIAVFLVWTLSRSRRQQRETQLTQSRVQPGIEVMMTSGVYGTVVEVEDDQTIRLQTSPGVVSRWDRRAVARIIASTDAVAGSEVEPGAPEQSEPGQNLSTAEPGAAVPVEPARPTTQDVAPPDRD
jgi:preprotein translocase subunit YajC